MRNILSTDSTFRDKSTPKPHIVIGMKKLLAIIIGLLISVAGVTPAYAAPQAVAPVLGDVVRGFDPPDQPWLAGHRGVDIAGVEGQSVVAAMDGVVSFAGMVAGRPVISINHGRLTTTYEPVQPSVTAGQSVAAGQTIGTLLAGHPCPVEACLHWGLKDGETYLDPLSLLSGGDIRLITADAMDTVRAHAAAMAQSLGGPASAAGLVSPAAGDVSSPFGMRLHPILGTWRFHDGMDIAASCGSPITAAAAGTVVESFYSSGYGNRLVIDHGVVNGHQLRTAYNHAQGYVVSVGDQVTQGQLIGSVGTTGASTGCHLHFQVWLDGALTDPQPLLP